jgi:hypothetical protein
MASATKTGSGHGERHNPNLQRSVAQTEPGVAHARHRPTASDPLRVCRQPETPTTASDNL